MVDDGGFGDFGLIFGWVDGYVLVFIFDVVLIYGEVV